MRKLIKFLFRPLLDPIKNLIQRSLLEKIENNEKFTSDRIQQIKDVLIQNASRLERIESVLPEIHQQAKLNSTDVFISNGMIDDTCYLKKSMENQNIQLNQIKNQYPNDGWYFLFENLFRGSEASIYEQQKKYIKYIKDSHEQLTESDKSKKILDFGSGRCEFLKILKENHIPAMGVDSNELNVFLAANKGVEVTLADGLEFLQSLPDDSLAGLTLFQVAEHLPFSTLKSTLEVAFKKIVKNGIIIIETVNPTNSFSMQYFYLDPTHIRPFHPETLKFASEWIGFSHSFIHFYCPINLQKKLDDTTNYLGYALIATK